MQPAEMRDTGALLGSALGELTELTRDVHKAVAGRLFGLFGSAAAPIKRLHDAIFSTAYGGTRLGLQVLPTVAGFVAAETRTQSTDSVHDTPRGHVTLSALNGFWGDRLAEQRAALAPAMSLRTQDGRLRQLPGNVVHDLGEEPTGKLVIFVHGLCENERHWWFGAAKNWGDREVTVGSRLRDDRDWTPLYLHYNTGLHVSENGRLLAEYLEPLVGSWPVPVTEIALVGHSMGGLVARSAAHQAAANGLTWLEALRHVVGLGAPHLGAPLERWVNASTHTMAKLPETRPIATWLNLRSAGIKDLRHGALVQDDWLNVDPDDPLDRCTPASLLPGIAYSMVSATLSREPDGPFGHDLLVEHVSAHGTGRPNSTRRIEFEVDRLRHLGRRTHFHLLNDPVVYEQLRSWLDGADGAPGPYCADAQAPSPVL